MENIISDANIWYMTEPQLCPYLPQKQERRIFTRIPDSRARHLDSEFAHAGFRRSRDVFYRPFCVGCDACVSVRICASDFETSQSVRRILKRNEDIHVVILPPKATLEQFNLLQSYLFNRHAESKMAAMSFENYTEMVEDTHVQTQIMEFRLNDALLAVSLGDVLQDGLSMTYSFFEPAAAKRSLGNFMILKHIEHARALSLEYVYLGYWVEGSNKMSYKTRFRPLERLYPDGWKPMK
ncbi:MAG: arginyltransferase [Hyphomicrobiales bacterium]|nr:arginyltransferase [Hyphomicrobiales bacterium]